MREITETNMDDFWVSQIEPATDVWAHIGKDN